MERRYAAAVVLAALVLSAWLNFRGLDWGLVETPGGVLLTQHPDEDANLRAVRHLLAGGAPDGVRPTHLKGMLFYSQLKGLAILLEPWAEPDSKAFLLACRALVAAQGVLLVAATALLAWRLRGPWTAALSALLLAAAPGPVALSHMATQDIPAALWAVLCLIAAVEAEKGRGGWVLAAAVGAFAGLGAATKHSLALLALPAAFALRGSSARGRAAAAIAFLAFWLAADSVLWTQPELARRAAVMVAENNRIGQPYHLARLPGWLDYAWSVLPFSLELPLSALSLAGLRRLWKGGRVLLVYLGAYWLLLGFDNVRLVRYTVPIAPVLCLAAADGLAWVWGRSRPAAALLALAAFGAALHHSGAYTGAMMRPHPRLRAFLWAMKNIPAGGVIAVPERSFSRLPTPPQAKVVSVDWDAEKLETSGAAWFALSDIPWLAYQEAGEKTPGPAALIREVEQSGRWTLAAEFRNPQRFLGIPLERSRPPHDWLYVNPRLAIYRSVEREGELSDGRP